MLGQSVLGQTILAQSGSDKVIIFDGWVDRCKIVSEWDDVEKDQQDSKQCEGN